MTKWKGTLAAVFISAGMAAAQGFLTVANPHWNITLTDFGYSDFLLDNTPGFQGREYLSGEWGAAISYQVQGQPVVKPQWLEPHFAYPDWTTPSTFGIVSPMTDLGLNTNGLPIAQSVISNADVSITIRCEMIDTIVGTPMGTAPASAGGAGTAIHSDRYVMRQTYTIRNLSGFPITGLQLFQFLHGLQSQWGVYDDRAYPGPYGPHRYDTTLVGVDASAAGAGSSTLGLEDYIAFHSPVMPTAFETGYYGVEGNGMDLHVLGKPSEGVHLSIEDNWESAPYAARQGTDSFAPAQRWLAGAQRWTLGDLAVGQAVSLDVLLSVCTGTKVDTGTGSSGGCNGGASVPGGLDFQFDDVIEPGTCFAEYSQMDAEEIEVKIAHGDFGPLDCPTPGGLAQLWKVTFSGTFNGSATLTFAY